MTKQYSAEEQAIIDMLERGKGRPLTQQEINLSLAQARSIGELAEPEQKYIDVMAKLEGRALTPREVNLWIEQAKALGDL